MSLEKIMVVDDQKEYLEWLSFYLKSLVGR